ncbi:hypothetical protein COB57_00900 [Candidatus Peregrinibacteria bacterium]|nr:MAG: hypothetical protein COB57_00900 [Candidatus Peregrinibacteria bacterium]
MFQRESSIFIALFLLVNVLFFSYAYIEIKQDEQIFQKLHSLKIDNQQLKKQVKDMAIKNQNEHIESSSIIDTVQNIKKSVVSIIATKELPTFRKNFQYYFDPYSQSFYIQPEQQETKTVQVSGGSGFIYSNNGYILTNKHVVQDLESDYTVVLFDGTEIPATVLARDEFQDVAVLKIEQEDQKFYPIAFGNSERVQPGQQVIAIGNALAEFQNTVTTGIISGLGRSIIAGDRQKHSSIDNLLQTDAAINPGNSGGPLLDLQGNVIGMNTAIAQGANGIGFAIPINDILSIAKSVEKYNKIIHPFLGIRYMTLSPKIATDLQLEYTEGAIILGDEKETGIIKDSPADIAGLQMGDIIVEINGQKITADINLQKIILESEIGISIPLTLIRNEEEIKTHVTLTSM